MKRRQHWSRAFSFLSFLFSDFLRIMGKGAGEERREGVREGEEEKREKS